MARARIQAPIIANLMFLGVEIVLTTSGKQIVPNLKETKVRYEFNNHYYYYYYIKNLYSALFQKALKRFTIKHYNLHIHKIESRRTY